MPPASTQPFGAEMDPYASMPTGEPLILAAPPPTAPFLLRGRTTAIAGAGAAARKPLRPRKQRPPVATAVDPHQVRNATAPTTLRAPAPQPPAIAAPTMAVSTFRGGQDNNMSIPPDTAGGVGPTHVFNPLNNNVSIFDRGGTLISSLRLDDFWAALGLTGNTFDPKVAYDSREGRFVFVAMADATLPSSSLYVAVSETSDPTQNWIADAIQVDDSAQGPVWLDYPSIAFTADKVTIQVNLFARADNRFAGSTIYVFDKRSLYDPPHQTALQRFVLRNQGGTHVPAVTHDATANDQYLLTSWSGNVNGDGYLAAYRVSGSVAAGQATLTRIGFILSGGATWDPFPPGDFGPQAGIPDKVDIGDHRILSVCHRDGVLYCCHTVMVPAGGPTRSAVQWWEIDAGTWTVNALERVDDPAGRTCYGFPSLAVNRRGDLAVGLSQFSAATHPSAAFVYKARGTPPQPPRIYAAGRATYAKTFGGHANRWGDYSATQVDPINDTDFWTLQEYAESPADTWGTMWARITMSAPPSA